MKPDYSPHSAAVAAHVARCRSLTVAEIERLAGEDEWSAEHARALTEASRAVGRRVEFLVWDLTWDLVWDAAQRDDLPAHVVGRAASIAADAAVALAARDLISPEQFDLLYGPWAAVMGPPR